MRLFIAVELPKAVRNEVGAALKELKMLSSGGRFVQENNLHITLHFIGESNDLAGAVKAMQSAVRGKICVLPGFQVLKGAAAARLLSRSAEIQANWQFCMSRFKPHWLITGLHANTDALFRI